MVKYTISILLIIAVYAASALPLFAGDRQTNQTNQTEKVRSKIRKLGIGERVKVKVKLYNDSSYTGYVSQVNEDDFVVVDKAGDSHTVKYSDVKSVGGKNLSTGAKIAIGIGIGVGATILVILAIFASLDQ